VMITIRLSQLAGNLSIAMADGMYAAGKIIKNQPI